MRFFILRITERIGHKERGICIMYIKKRKKKEEKERKKRKRAYIKKKGSLHQYKKGVYIYICKSTGR